MFQQAGDHILQSKTKDPEANSIFGFLSRGGAVVTTALKQPKQISLQVIACLEFRGFDHLNLQFTILKAWFSLHWFHLYSLW